MSKYVRDLVLLGAPVLRQVAAPVKPGSKAANRLAKELRATVQAYHGYGLAAPQIGESARALAMAAAAEAAEPGQPLRYTVVLNPEILEASDATEDAVERCLSIPTLQGEVPRHKWVRVAYDRPDGAGGRVEEELHGLQARIFQHELDHLDGLVFLDRMDLTKLAMDLDLGEWTEEDEEALLAD